MDPEPQLLDLSLCFIVTIFLSWWRHQMETFSALLAICAGNSPVPGEFPTQRPATRSFYVFFDLRLNKRLSKQSWGWWFETLPRPLWRHCNIIRLRWKLAQPCLYTTTLSRYEVGDLFSWEILILIVISYLLIAEKIWNSAEINFSSTLNFY